MQHRHEELRSREFAQLLEELTGQLITDDVRQRVIRGANEEDLVNSGLDDTMRNGYRQLSEVLNSNDKVQDLRTAGYVIAIEKISRTYLDIGIY